jgi:dihydrofolate reductase
VVSAFAHQHLIDEYQIFVHPVLLGGGSPLFPSLDGRQAMVLREARTFDDKVAGLRYARVR